MLLSKLRINTQGVVRKFVPHYHCSLRSLTSNSRTWGYECSKFADITTEEILLERSLSSGCNLVLVRSGNFWRRNYELLTDIISSEDVDVSNLRVGHRLSPSNPTLSQDALLFEWRNELTEIAKIYPKLNFVTFSSSVLRDTIVPKAPDGLPSIVPTLLDNAALIESFVRKFKAMAIEAIGTKVGVGIDFTTEHLHSMGEIEAKDNLFFLQHLVQAPHCAGDDLLQIALVSTNAWTTHCSPEIISTAAANSYYVISTEVLRAETRRPGLISEPKLELMAASIFQKMRMLGNDTAVGDTSGDASSEKRLMLAAMNALKDALNTGIRLEKHFLEKILPSLDLEVNLPHILWSHSLANAQHKLNSFEEWSVLRQNQMEPLMKAELEKLKNHNKEMKDFVRVLTGAIFDVAMALDVLYLTRKKVLVENVRESIRLSESDISTISLPVRLGCLALSQGSNAVTVANTQIRTTEICTALVDDLLASGELESSKAQFAAVKTVLQTFCHEE